MPRMLNGQGACESPSRGLHTPEQLRNYRWCLSILVGRWPYRVLGGKRCTQIVRDDCTFTGFISETEVGRGQRVRIVPSGGASRRHAIRRHGCVIRQQWGVFRVKFSKICCKRDIKQEITAADSPRYNDVAERSLALIDDAAFDACIQVTEL